MTGYNVWTAQIEQAAGPFNQAIVPNGAVGLLVGGTIAGAHNLQAFKDGEKSREDAIRDTVKAAVFAGAASFAAGLAANAIGGRGIVQTAAAATTGTAVMYLLLKAAKKNEGTAS